MPNLAELIGKADLAAHELSRLLVSIRDEYHLGSSPLGASATSSASLTGESGGAGPASATTGLTDAQIVETILTFGAWVWGGNESEITEQDVREVLAAYRSSEHFKASAPGGVESQPLPSDRPQDNWPGASSDPTSPRERSVPTPTPTPIDWSEALRMADALRCGLWAKWNAPSEIKLRDLCLKADALCAYLLVLSPR